MSFIALTTTSNHRSRKKRSLSSGARVQTEFLEYMDPGTWHLAIFNDQDEEDTFELTTSISSKFPISAFSIKEFYSLPSMSKKEVALLEGRLLSSR